MMERLRMGVIGAGMMGQRHCRVYTTLRRAQLVGVCDAAQQVGQPIARQHPVPFYSQVDDLLDQVDAVSRVTPTPAHYALAMRCLERGIHVLVEKPITETVEQAESLTRAAEESGLVVQVGHIERFNPTYLELKNVLDSMTVLAINLRRLSPYEGSRTDVDVVLDLMIHDTNLVLDLVGQEPSAVSAYGPFDNGSDMVRNQSFISGLYYDPNALNSGSQAEKDRLLLYADQIRVGLAGNLASYSSSEKDLEFFAVKQVQNRGNFSKSLS